MAYIPFKCVAVDYEAGTWQGDMYQDYGKGWQPTGVIKELNYTLFIPEVGSVYSGDLRVAF
jgi:hypothetical protein